MADQATEPQYLLNIPKLATRCAVWAAASFFANVAEVVVRPAILVKLASLGLGRLYLQVWLTAVITCMFVSLAGLEVCYYLVLRRRVQRRELSEFGLAVRSIGGGLAILGLFVFALALNDGTLFGT